MSFSTGLEGLLEKVAFNAGPSTAIHPEAMHPQYAARVARRQQPMPQAQTLLPGGERVGQNPAEARFHAATAPYAQQEARQMQDPHLRGVIQEGNQHAQANPGGLGQGAAPPPAAPNLATRARAGVGGAFGAVRQGVGAVGRRLATPLALGIGGAVLGGGLMSGYNEDQKYNNLAYAPVGQNSF